MDMGKDIIFAGDSLIEFFDWQERFPAHRVSNLGRAGETVEGLLARVDQIIKDHPSADLVFIMTGINNVAMEDAGFLGAYRDVLKKLSSAYPAARLYVHSLLPTLLPWISEAAVQEANRRLAALADECGAGFLDVHSLFVGKGVRECLSADGVHVSDAGYAAWSEFIEKTMEGG
jgi:lysophospholipase L1-like esterase